MFDNVHWLKLSRVAKLRISVGGGYPRNGVILQGLLVLTVYHSLEVYISEAVGS